MLVGVLDVLHRVLAFSFGFSVCYTLLFLHKRYVAYNQFVALKNQLAAFVAVDERIAGLYPPGYLGGSGGDILVEGNEADAGHVPDKKLWEIVSDPDEKIIQKHFASRIEDMADRTSDTSIGAALRYTLSKTGKMVRSRLTILLSRFLQIPHEGKIFKIAQIVELEHCASLLHDDVVDEADTRRGVPSHRKLFGDRTAVLAGDNLISLLVDVLAEIGDMRITTAIANSIEGLVVGELLQLVEGEKQKNEGAKKSDPNTPWNTPLLIESRIAHYIRKSYFKTASLFSAIGECVACCGDDMGSIQPHLARFGYFFGMAFQLVDDLLDFGGSTDIGKPGNGADIRNGTATLPVLYACIDAQNLSDSERHNLVTMLGRKFKNFGDCEKTLFLVRKSSGIEKTRKLVSQYFQKCKQELEVVARKVPTDPKFHDGILSLLHAFEQRTN